MSAVNPKCGSCKSYWKPDETDVKSSGLVCKSCKKCRALQKNKRLVLKQPKKTINAKPTNFLDMLNDDLLDEIYHQVHRGRYVNVMKDLKGYFQVKGSNKISEYYRKSARYLRKFNWSGNDFDETFLQDVEINNINDEMMVYLCQRRLRCMSFLNTRRLPLLCYDITNYFRETGQTIEEYFDDVFVGDEESEEEEDEEILIFT